MNTGGGGGGGGAFDDGEAEQSTTVGADGGSGKVTVRFLAPLPATAPDAPTSLGATAGNKQVELSWTAPASDGGKPITGYTIEHNDGTGWTTAVADTGSDATSHTVSGLTNGTKYSFRVSAINSVGTGAASDPADATPAPVTPDAPTSLQATAGDEQVVLSWTAPASDGGAAITGYRIEQSTDGSNWSDAVADTKSTSTTYTVSGLTNGTKYSFRVSAINAVGTGTASTKTDATPLAVPDAPGLLQATAGDEQVALSWTAPASDGGAAITGYRIEQSTDGSNWSDAVADTKSTSTTYTVTGLTNGTKYSFRVSAINAVGTGSVSTTADAIPAVVPDAPSSLQATARDQQVVLSWTAPASDGGRAITGYRIEQSTDGSNWSDAVADTKSTSTTYTVSGLTNGTNYYFRVSAINAVGTGSVSTTADAIPAVVPDAPSTLRAFAGGGEVELLWTAPASDGGRAITGYRIQQSTDGTNWTTVKADTGSDQTDYTVTGLTNGIRYYFRVSAITAAGTGPVSNSADATPAVAPDAPTSLEAESGNRKAQLSWTAPASDGGRPIEGYLIEQSDDGGTNWTIAVEDTASTRTNYTVTGLTNGTTYTFRVSAITLWATGGASNTASATPAPTVPDAPTPLSAASGDGRVDLDWTEPTSDGGSPITGYRIEQSTDGVNWGAAVADTGSTTTTYVVTGLTNGTRYSFRVAAINAVGTGAFSNTAQITPTAGVVGPVVPGSNPYLPAGGLPLGGSLLLVDGRPAPINVSPDAATDPSGLNITGPGFTMRLVGQTANNKPLGLTPDGALLLEQDRTAYTEGTGFAALSEVELYVFSTQRFLGTINTDANGAFRGSVPLPMDIPAGRHTLQANGLAPDGAVRSLSLGVQVQADDKGRQRPTARAGLPKRIATDGRTVLAPRNPRTTAGQRIITVVRCTPRGVQAAGETRLCSVIRGPQGKVTLRAFGIPVKVVVVQKARATNLYTAYLKRTVYLDGRRR